MDKGQDAQVLGSIRAVIRLARIAQQVCEQGGLTLAQYRALSSSAKGDQRAYELAQYAAVSRPAISALTNGMVKANLIERSGTAADGRGVLFSITTEGLDRLRTVEARLVERFREVLGDARDALVPLSSGVLEAALDAQVDKEFGPPGRDRVPGKR